MISGCVAKDAKEIETWTKSILDPWLAGELPSQLSPAKNGQAIRLAALISTGPQERNSCLTIRFDRREFTQQFLSSLFADFTNASDFVPFTSNGVEVVLSDEFVFLNVYPGVVLLLRPDLTYPGKTRAFAGNDAVGRVEWVEGAVGIAEQISALGKLRNFAVAPVSKEILIDRRDVTTQKDGGITAVVPVGQADLPKRSPPRRAKGDEKPVRCAL